MQFSIPDLQFRIRSINSIEIPKHDNKILKFIILKEAYKKNIRLHPKSLNMILNNIDRSISSISKLIDVIHRYNTSNNIISLATIKKILKENYKI